MAQSKIEKIASIEQEIKQIKERQKQLLQQHNLQEHKDGTKRLCQRMGLLESMLPNTITLADEQFKLFLEKTIHTDQSRRIQDESTAQNAATATPQGGAWGAKQKKEYILDKNGNKIYDKKKRQYKCKSIPATDWNDQTKAGEISLFAITV